MPFFLEASQTRESLVDEAIKLFKDNFSRLMKIYLQNNNNNLQ
jgi:hypothetical protein